MTNSLVPVTMLASAGTLIGTGILSLVNSSGGPDGGVWAASGVLTMAGGLVGWIGKRWLSGDVVARNTAEELRRLEDLRRVAEERGVSLEKALIEYHTLLLEATGALAVVRDVILRSNRGDGHIMYPEQQISRRQEQPTPAS